MERSNIEVLEKNLLAGFDVHLQEFYKKVIGKEIESKFNTYAKEINGILEEIILHYKKRVTEKHAIDLRFKTRKRRCAYVLKHSPLFTSTVAFHFSELLKQNRNILTKPFERRRLNLCCLGGGPASELVAIAKVLGPLYLSTGNQEPLELNVTIVDINEHWKTTCEYVIECLKEDDTFLGMDRITIDFSLVQADLSKPFKEDAKEVIEKADIITMVYFVSAVNGGKDSDESLEMIKKIMEIIKQDCVVFFLDNATDVHFQQMDQAAKETCDMEITYEPCVEELQYLTYESVEKFLEIYEGHFDLYNCMTNGFMSYCVWRKVRDILDPDEVKEKERQEKLKSQKNNELLTKRMNDYKRILRRYVQDVEKNNREKSRVYWNREAKESSHPTNYTTESKQNIFEDIRNRKIQTLTEQHESIGVTEIDPPENVISKEFCLKNRQNIKNADEKKTPKAINPLQKPRTLNSKNHASLSQQEDNDKDGQHDDSTVAEERNAKQEKCNEGESNRNKIFKNYPKGSDVQPPTNNDQVENNKQKSKIHFSCDETGKIINSEEAKEVYLMKKPNVPTVPLKKPRGRKNSGAPSSNPHLNDNNEE